MRPPKADVVACGPEASGTRALMVNTERLCAPYDISVRHLSLPLGDWWWGPEDIAGEKTVIITRRPDYQSIACWKQGCARSAEEAAGEWPRAIATLASIPDAHWVLYEAMMADAVTQFRGICAFLGIDFDERLLQRDDQWWPWRDENRKYYQ